MTRTPRIVATLLAAALTLSGCGLPEDGEPVPVALPDDFELEPTTTTTSTIPPDQDAGQRPIYLIEDGALTRRFREVATPVDAQVVIDVLVAGLTDEEAEQNLETRVPADLDIEAITREDNIVILNIRGEFDDETPLLPLEGEARIELVGQLVLTAIGAEASNQGVIFQENGERFATLPDAAGVLQAIDEATGEPEPLTREDFDDLRPGAT